ncbi:MAG: hypothetical protein ABI970_24105 [Chloroflexota bacterium]
MIYIIFGLVIVICYWALWQPERAFRRGARCWLLWLVVIGYTSLAALASTGEKPFFSPLFIVFPILYGVLLRGVIRRLFAGLIRSRLGRYSLVFALLWFSEIFAALDIASYDPLGRHMLIYVGFYIGLALVIVYFLSHWRFTFPALFTLGGLWGLLVEQQFLGSKMLLSGNIIGFLIFASITFPVYGFYLAGPYLLLYEELSPNPRTSRWQYILLFIALTLIPFVTWGIWTLLLKLLGADTTVYVV